MDQRVDLKSLLEDQYMYIKSCNKHEMVYNCFVHPVNVLVTQPYTTKTNVNFSKEKYGKNIKMLKYNRPALTVILFLYGKKQKCL